MTQSDWHKNSSATMASNIDNRLIVQDKLLLSWTQIHSKIYNVKPIRIEQFLDYNSRYFHHFAVKQHAALLGVFARILFLEVFKATEMKAYADNRLWEESNICDSAKRVLSCIKAIKRHFNLRRLQINYKPKVCWITCVTGVRPMYPHII